MLAVSDAYKSAAANNVQSAFIKVEVGRFGIHATPTGNAAADILATYYSDSVQSCTISGSIGDGGAYSIGSLAAHQCDLSIFTSAVDTLIRNINTLDVRVSFGYRVVFGYDAATETVTVPGMHVDGDTIVFSNYTCSFDDGTLELDTVEWAVKGVFAADKSLVTKNGLTTSITLYDAAYWLDTVALSGEPFKPVGEPDTLHNMVNTLCSEYGITLAADALTTLPDTTLYTYRPTAGCTVREAIGQLAAAGFCNAVMHDNELHFVKIKDTGVSLTPADFQDIPSFDFCETTVDQITVNVTETFEYTSGSDEQKYKEPTVSIVKNSNSAVRDFPGNTAKGDKFILYIRGGGTNINDYDSATDAPWATVTYTGSGAYKGKTLLEIYNAGKMMGVYLGAGIHGVGRNAFNLKRYNSKVYFRGASTYYFGDDGYGKPSFYSGTKLYGDSKGNVKTDWEAISAEKGEDQEHALGYPADRAEGIDNNVIEFDPALFAGGTVNSLMDDGALMAKVEQDFAAIGANGTLPFTYKGASVDMFGRDYFSVGDKLTVTDVYGETNPLYVLSATYSFAGGIGCTYSSEGISADVAAGGYTGNGSTKAILDKVEKEAVDAADKSIEAIEKAEEVIKDANLAASLGDEAYDTVYPITSAMRTLLANALAEADKMAEGVLDEMQYTYVSANDFANVKSEFKSSNYRSATRWTSTYTEEYDAWASEDAETQAQIAAAKALLDTANAALDTAYDNEAVAEADVAATMSELVRRIKALDKGKSDKNSISSQLSAAKSNVSKLKKDKKAKAKTIAAAQKLVNELQAQYDTAVSDITKLEANLAEAIYAVFGADGMSDVSGMIDKEAYDACAAYFADSTWLAGMQSSYGDGSKAALVVAEQSVSRAEAEVDTAINGIHGVRTSVIEQTAQKVRISVTDTDLNDKYEAALEVTAKAIQSFVSSAGGSSTYTQTDDGFNFTITSNMTAVQDGTARNAASSAQSTASTANSKASSALSAANSAQSAASSAQSDVNAVKAYMSFTNNSGTGTLTLGGSSTEITMGGSSSTINMGGTLSTINMGAARITYYSGALNVSPRGSSGNTGLYIDSSGVMVGSTSSMNGGVVDCGRVITVNSISCGGSVRADSDVTAIGDVIANYGAGAGIGLKASGSNYGVYSWGTSSVSSSKWLIYRVAGGTVTCGSSSRQTKENIKPVTEEEACKLLDVETVTFDYRESECLDGDTTARKGWIGVIAEDVYKTIPRAVCNPEGIDIAKEIAEGGDTSSLGVDYQTFIPYLIKLCQMQQAQIDALTARIDALEGK